MDLHRIRPGSASGVSAKSTDADRLRPAAPVRRASAQGSGADRVELSEAARAHRAQAQAREAEVSAAQRALHAQPEMSAERADEIRQRLADGFYDRPDVVAATAERLARDLPA